MSSHICTEHGSDRERDTERCPLWFASKCQICGREKIYHLCPDCDQDIIRTRQARLESSLQSARNAQIARQKATKNEVHLKDLWAQQNLQEYDNHQGLLRRSIILGIGVSIPLIAIGLDMVIEGIIRPLGIAAVFGGIAALSTSIHFRIAHDNVKMARNWMSLTFKQKAQLMEGNQPQQPDTNKPILYRQMVNSKKAY